MYSSLHNHDYYSLLDGYGSPKEMLDRAKELGLKAYATTNHGNAYSFIYYDLLKKEYPDIKLIFGTELYECNDITVKDKDNKYFHLICLVRNEQGRKDLNKVITKSNFEGFYFKPRCTIDDLKPYAENFVISSACLASKIAREEDFNKCIEYINEYKEAFPYFYLEMQSHQHQDQCLYNQKILELSKITNTPFIITTDSHAPKKEDLYYQDKLIQIGRKSTNNDKNAIENSEVYEGCYMQSEEEIHECMDSQIGYENVCIGLDNTNKVADLIDNVNMPFQSPQLPTFPLPDGFNDNNEFLWHLIKEGWKDRGYDKLSEKEQQIRRDRLNYEMKIIHEMGFDGYFLFVWDFINAAQKLGVEVGKGRGSAAGSLVCYCCHITDIDPIKYGLIFERFLNPERVGLPDIDTDVGDRDAIIKYLVDKYGEDRVCQIINYSYITPTVAITDVGKILGFPYNQMQKLSQKFTFDKWDDCIKVNPTLINDNPQYADLFDIASHLSGRVKTVSIHAGGVGIVDTSINDYMPMKIGTKGEHVIQVDKHYIEGIGIVKFDLLGVATLNIVKEIKDDLHLDPWLYDINNHEFETDIDSYKLLGSGKTNGVFQVESAGMKDLMVRLQPKNINDVAAVVSLYRPDSMGALEEYVDIAISGKTPEYIHPDMIPILKDTNGCLLYQEQLLDIVKKFGGRTYGKADLFRRGIAKKDKDLVKRESEKLRDEIVQNGYPNKLANQIADDMSAKGGYIFNKSHGYSYAVLCFETAWFKAHYPTYFFKALFNQNKDKAGAINKYILDARYFNVEVSPPNINLSGMNFTVHDDKVLFGLSAISGIGESLSAQIIEERDKNGKFKSFEDLISRIPLSKSAVMALIKSGAIPCKNKKKKLISYLKSQYQALKFSKVQSLPTYKKLEEEWHIDLSKYEIPSTSKRVKYDKEKLLEEYNRLKEEDFNQKQEIRYQKYIEENNKYLEDEQFWEFQTLQVFINDNPFDAAYTFLVPFEDVENGDKCTIVGIIAKVQKKKDKNGKQFAYINIYSSFGLVEGIVWHSTLKEFEDLIKKGQQVAILCKKDSEEKVIVEKIKPYNEWIKYVRKKGAKV
ncbi:DNA polymerase III subunit alpha [Blautia faecis]|jgi:DNA polymerase-3 subunit alpha|uniref:DNA polymerase III subunit alpha n=1 Tax=Blautia faecis TaxID=871665 RepID=UPI00204C0206|nr:DNA polymerase III subunit alpha [Blautia faecis]MDT4370712.1 DNA polymerase III subunit alpha [Blautia faecis]DAR32054.1 MAG TPA: DNA polymerase III, alpha subunit [Caudoviricetes sp.]